MKNTAVAVSYFKSFFLLCLSLICLLSCEKKRDDSPYPPIEYILAFGENEAGFFESSRDSNGIYHYVFEYNDRGRGPHLEESLSLDADGFIRELNIQGHNYLKDTVNEKFAIEGSQANWKSSSENGNSSFTGKEFYLALNGTPGSMELLVRAMLVSPDRSISLFPSGKSYISDIQEHQLEDSISLRLIEISGLSFTPYYLWFDKDNRLYASVSTWLSCIRRGETALAHRLLEIQTEVEKSYYQRMASELSEIPEKAVVIQNVQIFNPFTGSMEPNRAVRIEGELIISVSPDDEIDTKDAQLIDGGGKTLLPGLFDNHTHLSRSQGILNLAAGVTSVRDMANSFDLPDIRDEFNTNKVLGPRIVVMSGFIDQAGPYAGPTGKIVKSLNEALEAVDFYQERGYQQIKLYSSIDPGWVKPIAEKAHSLGLRVSGHIPAHMLAQQAVRDGYNEIQHINMIALNFMSDTIDTRTPLRFSMVGRHARETDVNGTAFMEFVNLLKQKNIAVDPTVSIFEGMLCSSAGEPDPQFAQIIDRLPIQIQREFYSGGLPIPEGMTDIYKESYQRLLDMIRKLHEEGVTLLPGTDAMPGFALHKELENYVRAGIPAAEVLKMATIVSAQITKTDQILGSIDEGKLADMILIDGDPSKNISDIRRVEITIKDGKIYDCKKLYESIGVRHFK